jgi:alkylation response protein AidB-like acyl-CoA dehydrogenase
MTEAGPFKDEIEDAIGELAALVNKVDEVELFGRQYDLGLAWPRFAPPWGGWGLSADSGLHVSQRLRSRGVPPSPAGFVGLHQVSTLLHDIGADEQKLRYLRRIFTGEDQWCQLFSEPGAGSDLANVSCIARLSGDEWVLDGQKVWTSNARHANLGLLLARTDPGARKHSGMTMFIVDMTTPGIEVRPLRQADGGARFSEVFLDGVVVPDSLRLGTPGQGWALSMRILATERGGASDVFLRPVAELLELWASRGHAARAARDDVAQRWIESRVIALNGERQRTTSDADTAKRLASIAKVMSSEHSQRVSSTLATLLGPDILVAADFDEALAEDIRPQSAAMKDFAALPPARFLVRARAMSIEGGTNEISRNIIGERVLGLPPDIRVDKDRPWVEVTKG